MNDDEFYKKTEDALRDLFDRARSKRELHFVLALCPEFKGMRDPGWNTADEAHLALEEYIEFLNVPHKTKLHFRVALGFYCHLAEASGFYEIPKNMLRIAGGEMHSCRPFDHLVHAHKQTGDLIAPNANKVLKDLAGHAKTLGLDELAEVFRDAFDPDVRNGYAHADYVIWNTGLRLPRRNGGNPIEIPWDKFSQIIERGVKFFQILTEIAREQVQRYNPPIEITGKLHNDDPEEMYWTVAFDPTIGLTISGSG